MISFYLDLNLTFSLTGGGSIGVKGSTYLEEVVSLLSPPPEYAGAENPGASLQNVLVKTRVFFAVNGGGYVMHWRNDT